MSQLPASLIQLSKMSQVLTDEMFKEGPIDKHPHGMEGRLLRPAAPPATKIKKTEGPRAYAPRI